MKKTLTAPDVPKDTIRLIAEALRSLPSHGSQLKDRRNQKITRFQVDSLDLVAKEYQIDRPSRKISALLGHSRARRSFRAGLQLLQAGIDTPKPILLIEEGRPFYSRSILITEFHPGLTLHQILISGKRPPDSVTANLHDILSRLLKHRIRHGDFHSLNLIISPDGPVSVIDLDSARKRFSNRRITDNIKSDRDRLLSSVIAFPEYRQTLIETLGEPGSPFPPS